MTQSDAKNTDKILAGEYALGLLSDQENTKFEARLETEPQLRRYHANWVEDFVTLTDDIGEVAPPVGFYAGMEIRLFDAPQVAEQATKSGSLVRLVRFVLGAAVAVVVCALILVAL